MLKTLKKAGLSLLSFAMVLSLVTFTPIKVSAALTETVLDSTNFVVSASGSDNVNDNKSVTDEMIKSALFDGSDTTFWQSNVLSTANSVSIENTWLQIDLGQEYIVSQLDYTGRNASATGVRYGAVGNVTGDVVVQLSNDATDWSNATTYTQDTLWGDEMQNPSSEYNLTTSVEIDNVSARYVRVSGTKGYHYTGGKEGTNICIADLKVYAMVDTPVNVAYQLPADQIKAVFTADGSNAKITSTNDRPLTKIVDGAKNDYAEFSRDTTTPESAYLELNLGKVYTLSEIKAYFYYDTRVYNNVVILTSKTESFDESDYTVVYNTDPDDVHGLGIEPGTAYTTAETAAGRTIPVDNVDAQYVRIYMYGSDASHKQNHINEIEVYGVEADAEIVDVDVKELADLVLLGTDEIGTTNPVGQYTVASFTAYETALANAQAVLDNADDTATAGPTEAEVTEAYDALDAAIKGLVSLEALRVNLEDAQNPDTTDMSAEWVNAYNKYLASTFESAEAVLADEDATEAEVNAADEALAEAVEGAYEYADAYDALSVAIKTAKEANTEGKTEDSVNALNIAIANAEATLADEAADAAAFLAQVTAVEEAVANLEDIPAPTFDKTALKAAIDEAKAIIEAEDYEGKYTEETATALEEAYSEALVVYEDDGSAYEEDEVNFQDYIDYATDTLNGAIDGLVLADEFEEVDREALLNLLDEYVEVYEGNNADATYVSATYEAFKAAYEAAVAVADNEDATQAEVDDIVTSLANAVDELAEVADKSLLVQAINAANPIVTAGNEGIYTVASWDAFIAANEAAVAINAKEDATQEEVDNATNALTAAQEALVDLTALKEAIAQAETKVKDDYTEETWADFEVEFNAAKGVVANNEATKEEVAEAVNNLNNAMGQLEEKPAFDKTSLKAAIDEAKAIIEAEDYEGKYSDETVTVFEDAYYEAIAVYEDDGSSYEEGEVNFQEYIDNATKALNYAIDGLELADEIEEVDKEALVDLLDEYYDVYEANNADSTYVSATYEAFKAAYEAGVAVDENTDATQAEVDEAVIALETAIAGLVETADKTLLVQAINAADPIITAGNDNVYTAETWNAFVAANEVAVAINAKEDATQEEVDNATNALVAAQEALAEIVVEPSVDKTALKAAIDQAVALGDVTIDEYTQASVEAFNVALSEANVIFNDDSEDVTQEAVDEATTNLLAAIQGLEKIEIEEVDKEALIDLLDEYAEIYEANNADSTYVSATYEAFKAAYEAGVAVDENTDATQAEVDEAVIALETAIAGLVETADKTLLVQAINAADPIITAGNDNVYTAETWNAFVAANEVAVAINAKEDATQEEVDNATNALVAAQEALAKVPEVVIENLALNLPAGQIKAVFTADGTDAKVTSVTGNMARPLTWMVDGSKADYSEFSLDQPEPVSSYLQLDLGDIYNLTEVKGYYYYEDGRKYTNVVVLVAETEDFADYTVVYNGDPDNVHGLNLEGGVAVEGNETAQGRSYPVNNVEARYVRIYMYGSTANHKQNHILEVEVFGNEIEKPDVPTIDKTALQAAIERADALGEVTTDDYTVESVEAFDAAYSEAVVIFNDDSEDVTQEAVDEATTNLIAAIEGLTPVQIDEVDKEILLSLIEEAEEIIPNADDYTAETYAAFKAAYDAAVVVADNEDATQEEVDNVANALDAAMEALEEVVVTPTIDKTALQAAIERADALGEVSSENYTVESVEAFDAAYSEAVVIFNDDSEDVTQEAVNEATANLIAAIEGLTPVQVDEVDKGALFALLEEAEEILPNADDYTTETYDAFKAAYDAAVAVADNEDATQAEVDNAVTALQTAMDALEIAVDKTALKALIDEVEALNGEDYSIKSWALATEALQAAKTVYENADATQEQVDAAKAELQAKKDALVDRSPLKPVLEEAEAKLAETDKYTPSTYNALKEVYDNAKFLYDNAGVNYVQQDVYTHKDRVEAAIQALVEKANKEALQALVNESKDAAENEDKYTAETWAPFKEAYDAALIVLANEEATQMEVDQATVVLRATKNALEEKPVEILDTKPLEDKIAEAKEFKEDEYYAPTYEALQTAIAAAEQALTTVTTNAQVAEEVAKLQAAIDALIARPARVTNLDAYAVNYKTIQIDWDAVEGATYYQIYRLNTQTGKWIKFKTSDTNSYTVTGVKTGVRYSYRVIANKVLDDGTVVAGKSSSTNSATALLEGEPVLTMKANGKTKFDLSWTKVDGATRYLVYRKSATEGWKKILTLGGSVTTYTTSSMVPNTYTFMIKAARYDSKDRTQTNGSNTCEGTSVFTKPVITVTKASSTSAKIAWKAVEGVKYYEVYRATSKSGTYSKLKTTTELSFTNKSLKAGKTYYYKVRAYRTYNNAKVYTSYSKVVSYTVK